jgi:diguanylate cyclase (GGDEF)-like protein/PAS domain S-box-containing protein
MTDPPPECAEPLPPTGTQLQAGHQLPLDSKRAEDALAASEAELRAVFGAMTDVVLIYDADGRYVKIAPTLPAMLYRPAREMLGKTVYEVLPAPQAQAIHGWIRQVLASRQMMNVEYALTIAGAEVWFYATVSPLSADQVLWIARDITERKQAEEETRRRNVQLATLNELGQALAHLATPDEIVRIIYANIGQVLDNRNLDIAFYDETQQSLSFPLSAREGALCAASSRPLGNGVIENVILTQTPLFLPDEVKETLDLLGIDQLDPTPQSLMAVPLVTGNRVLGVIAIQDYRHPNAYHPADLEVLSTIAAQAAAALENARLYAAVQQELAERQRAEKQLLHDAFHDTLTGLPNRALFLDRLGRAMERAKRIEQGQFAVLFLDLDRFKLVNDSLGHTLGDQLLIATARRLELCLRSMDTVARQGGDEFAILIEDAEAVEAVARVADRIQSELALPFDLGGHRLFNSASIGIVLSATGYERPEEVLRDADVAMYRAKVGGKARYEVFDSAMRNRAIARLDLENDLRSAVERQEFRVFYQPIVSLDSSRISGFEALVRWQHPRRGLVSPAEFISVAEETGLIIPIGQWVLREACRQIHQWQAQFPTILPLTISVNLSAKQFTQPDLKRQIEEILQETGLDASSLRLEITESVIMEDSEVATNMLSQLRTLGVQVLIDDFGTGYSSLSYLQQFPIDTLKIDRSFIGKMAAEGNGSEIVRTIMLLAREMGLQVVAEGVETSEQLAKLKAFGCDYAQGYFFCRPVEQQAAETFIVGMHGDVVGIPFCSALA